MRAKPQKTKLIFLYISFALIVYGISFISSSFVWSKECDLGCTRYFLPLFYPLELNVYVSPLPVYPPGMIWSLKIFGFEIMKITGNFYIGANTEMIFVAELITQMFTWITFTINLGFVLTWIMILYLIYKRKSKKPAKIEI